MKTFKSMVADQNGATIVYVAVILTVLMMFTALAVDVGYLYGVRNELQDAADAAALAGTSVLFNEDGTLNRDAALDEGARVAVANKTGKLPIAEKTVETGHWSHATRTFTARDNTEQLSDWQNRSAADLDTEPDFINAVRVKTDRSDTPSFFARILGYTSFFVSTDAVAVIGFAGTVDPLKFDQPIAICREYITGSDGDYTCDKGRMINSGNDPSTSNSGGWTNFTQDPCTQPTPNNAEGSGMLDMICSGNEFEVDTSKEGIGVKGGQAEPALNDLYDCWQDETEKVECSDNKNYPKSPMNMTLPVVICGMNNPTGCLKVVGAVNVDVIWITDQNDPQYKDVPCEMTAPGYEPWKCDKSTPGLDCWNDFVDHFNLESVEYMQKTLYFLPNCEFHKPIGNTGGQNFGILARIPKLVE